MRPRRSIENTARSRPPTHQAVGWRVPHESITPYTSTFSYTTRDGGQDKVTVERQVILVYVQHSSNTVQSSYSKACAAGLRVADCSPYTSAVAITLERNATQSAHTLSAHTTGPDMSMMASMGGTHNCTHTHVHTQTAPKPPHTQRTFAALLPEVHNCLKRPAVTVAW
jgi:hypothetical protein